MKAKFWVGVYLVLLGVVFFGGAANGQTTGEMRGAVKDPLGAIIQGASVTATLGGTDTTRTVLTDQDGDFDIPELPVGTYSVAAEVQGFKKYLAKDVIISIGHVTVVNMTLQIGGKSETVMVVANATQVETTSTQIGAVMTDASVRELPLSTRNTYELLQLQPGVQSQLGADLFYGSDNPGVVSVNGGRGRSNNYMVNGGDGNDIFVNGPAIQPTPDAIEEFRVLTNTFDAEYGRNSGSVVNVVTKSGTNDLHGDFFEFLRNDVLNTKGYFDNEVPDYKQNQFGGTLGGPIKKDRTFIFGSYEGNRLRQGVSSGSVILPSQKEAAGDFSDGPAFAGTVVDQTFATILANRTNGSSGLTCQQAVSAQGGGTIQPGAYFADIFKLNQIPIECFDPTAYALYQNYVAPYGVGKTSTVPVRDDRGDQFTIRFDHKLNSSQQISVYYYFDDDDRVDPFSNFQAAGANVPGFGAIFKTRTQQWNLSHTWTLGSNAVNEFHFNYFREGQGNLDHPVNLLTGANGLHDACGSYVPASECFQDQSNSVTSLLGLSSTPALGITTNLPGREGVPEVQVSGGFTIGNNYEGEFPQTGNTFQWTDNYTRTIGKHTAKFGGDVRRQRFDQFSYFETNGYYIFLSDANLCSATNTANCDQPTTNDVGYINSYPDFFIGTPSSFNQGAAQALNLRNTSLYLFGQDSYKFKPNLTLNYGLRWELNTPYYDTGNRVQTFRPGEATSQYTCALNPTNLSNPSAAVLASDYGSTDCNQNGPANAIFPLGLVFPGDKGVPRGLTATYFKAFAPRIGLAWSPGWTDGWLAKLTGGPGKSSIRTGYGLFYNPIEELVLAQFSAEPPFGGSAVVTNPNFNLPFLLQNGSEIPNVFQGVINQTPHSAVDWSWYRPMLLFGEFQPNLKSQYSEQYNLTIERQLTKSMLLRMAYVGTEAHHLLATHDLNYGHAETCLALQSLSNYYGDPSSGTQYDPTLSSSLSCGPFSSDSAYYIPITNAQGAATIIPAGMTLPLPYGSTPSVSGGASGITVASVAPNGINLVGLRKYSSPICQPLLGQALNSGCPADNIPVFSNIFAQDTIANSNYNGLQLSLEQGLSKGLLFQASYTYSKAIDQGASFESTLNPLNFDFSRGVSLLDARNRFVFSPYWQLPVPEFGGYKGKLLDGWGMSAIITYQSGFPIRMQTQDDLELMSSFNFEDPNTPQVAGQVHFENPKSATNLKDGTYYYIDPTNISDPPAGSFGNIPHALCCGPALSNTDLAVEKKTQINERWSAEFRAEFFNAWNHTQFANPDGNFSDLTFGQVTRIREDSRVIQFGLKFFF
jgi:hypothetical protein